MNKKRKKKKYQINRLYAKNLKILLAAVIIISILNIVLSKDTYVNENLNLMRCKGVKVFSYCLGREEQVVRFDLNLE